MNFMKKIVCIVLSVLICAGLFSACSGQKQAEKQEDQAAALSLKYTYDSHYASMDESAKRAFEKVAAAIVAGEETAQFNLELSGDVNRLLYTGFPLMALVDSMENLSDQSGVKIVYKNDAAAHLKLVAAFEEKVSTILSACHYTEVSSAVYLLNLYHYVATHTTYDDTVTDTYTAIMTGKGMSAAISGMFEYLALQGGVEASHIIGRDAVGNAWFFSRCMLGGQMYNFDIASELSVRGGEGLSCFAMTDEELVSAGLKKEFLYSDQEKALEIKMESNKFSALRSCAYYELDGTVIHATLYSGETKEIAL